MRNLDNHSAMATAVAAIAGVILGDNFLSWAAIQTEVFSLRKSAAILPPTAGLSKPWILCPARPWRLA